MSMNDWNDAFDKIMTKADSAIKMEEGDYVKDGLIYCGKCHKPKQTRVYIFGIEKKPMCLCDCGRSRVEQEKKHETDKLFRERIEKNKFNCFGNRTTLLGWTFESAMDTDSVKVARNYLKNFDELFKQGKGLFLFGDTGTGKTIAMLCIANRLLDAGYTVRFRDFSEIANELFCTTDKVALINELASVDALIIDDFAVERASDYMQEVVYSVINSRAELQKPIFITTNLSRKQINSPDTIAQKRVYDRILQYSLPYEVKGANLRRQAFIDSYNAYAAMLKGE